jgi:hypothetical protein
MKMGITKPDARRIKFEIARDAILSLNINSTNM